MIDNIQIQGLEDVILQDDRITDGLTANEAVAVGYNAVLANKHLRKINGVSIEGAEDITFTISGNEIIVTAV